MWEFELYQIIYIYIYIYKFILSIFWIVMLDSIKQFTILLYLISNNIFYLVQKQCFTSISICAVIQEGISSNHILVESTYIESKERAWATQLHLLEPHCKPTLVFFFSFDNLIIRERIFEHWMFLLKILRSANRGQDSWPSSWSVE